MIKWLNCNQIEHIQRELCGIDLRDRALLESALNRPQNLAAYGDDPDLCDLAAAYAVGIACNHPFTNGNKRISWVASCLFLEQNGLEVLMPNVLVVGLMIFTASGHISNIHFADYLRNHISESIAITGVKNIIEKYEDAIQTLAME